MKKNNNNNSNNDDSERPGCIEKSATNVSGRMGTTSQSSDGNGVSLDPIEGQKTQETTGKLFCQVERLIYVLHSHCA